jgi:hypothetical protein
VACEEGVLQADFAALQQVDEFGQATLGVAAAAAAGGDDD